MKPDGSRREWEECHYETDGGKKKVCFLDPDMANANCMHAVEGSGVGHTTNGATKMTTIYDQSGRPTEAHFHDASDQLLQRIVVTRDDAGRMVTEEVRLQGQFPFTGCTHGCTMQGAGSDQGVERLPQEDRAKIEAMLKELMGPADLLSKTTYSYDEKGRLLERTTSMLGMAADRSTFRYDEHDNTIATTEEDGSGGSRRDFRMQYQYDAWGNWTERIVSSLQTDGHFQPFHVERHEITYWDP